MALVKCPECGHDVSTTAEVCPNCGAPPELQWIPIEVEEMPPGSVQCRHCHAIVKPQGMQVGRGSLVIAILLLSLGIVPGLIYIMWETSRKQCPNCRLPIA